MMKYFIYARKSSEGEDRQVTSIQDQITYTQKLALELGLTVVEIISESKSAKEPGRPAFNLMLKRIHDGEANGIICWKLNRLARNPVDGGQISWMLQEGVLQHVQTYGRDYKPEDNVLMMQVEFGMANQFIKDLRGDIKRGTYEKAQRGWYPYTRLPYGYEHTRERGTHAEEIINDPKRFKKIQSLWQQALTGEYNVPLLKDLGDSIGLRTKQGKPLSYSVYERMFKNKFYAGYFSWRNLDGISQEIKGKHIAMVSLSEFKKIQEILSRNFVPKGNMTRDRGYTGIFECGECTCSITTECINRAYCKHCKVKFSIKNTDKCPKCLCSISKKTNFGFCNIMYYRCTKKKGKCSQKYISEIRLEKQILALLSKIQIPDKILNWALAQINEGVLKKNNDTFLKALKSERTQKLNRKQSYLMMRADNEISKSDFEKVNSELNDTLSNIEKKIFEIEDNEKNKEKSIKNALNFRNSALENFQNGDYSMKRQIINLVGSNPKIFNQNCCFSTISPLVETESINFLPFS